MAYTSLVVGNMSIKGLTDKAFKEFQKEILNESVKNETYELKLVGKKPKTLKIISKDDAEFLKSHTLEQFETRRKNRLEMIKKFQSMSKEAIETAMSYKNKTQDGKIIFKTRNFAEIEKRNLIPSQMRFNAEKIQICNDNTLLESPLELIHAGI